MGCCFGKSAGKSFEGEGQRLGSTNEANGRADTFENQEPIHQPIYDSSIDDATREQRRKEREEAAKARMARNQLGGGKKKKKDLSSQPLRGPNSRNTMTWSMGS